MLSVAKRLAETVTSRTAGFVTQVPRRIFLVLAAIKVRRGNGSFQITWESKIQPKEKPEDSACCVRLRMRSMEMSGLMVMPKSIRNLLLSDTSLPAAGRLFVGASKS